MLAIESKEIVLLSYNANIKKISLPEKSGSALFQIENRSNGKVVKKIKYPQWSYRDKREVSEYKWDTTSSSNSTTPDTKKTQQISQQCPHTVDGAIEVAKYIVDEIKRNIKSDTAKSIQELLIRWKSPQWYDAMGGSNPAKLYTSALGLWGLKVAPGMDWDHKPKIYENKSLKKVTVHRPLDANNKNSQLSKSHFHKYKGYDYYYDIWSNIHYGYMGLSVGFTEEELIDGSDLQQIMNPNTKGSDTIEDKFSIKIGINLCKNFGRNANKLTYQDILAVLDNAPIERISKSKHVHWCYNKRNPNRLNKK